MAVLFAILVGVAGGSVIGWRMGRAYAAEVNREIALDQKARGDYWFEQYRDAARAMERAE